MFPNRINPMGFPQGLILEAHGFLQLAKHSPMKKYGCTHGGKFPHIELWVHPWVHPWAPMGAPMGAHGGPWGRLIHPWVLLFLFTPILGVNTPFTKSINWGRIITVPHFKHAKFQIATIRGYKVISPNRFTENMD